METLTAAQIAALRDLEKHGQYYHHDNHSESTYRALQARGLIEWSSSAAGGWYITPAGTDAYLAHQS